jgi:hypothetical protein
MSRSTIRVACHQCDAAGTVEDDRGIGVVCPGCLGMGFLHENAPGPACDVQTHETVRPMAQAS